MFARHGGGGGGTSRPSKWHVLALALLGKGYLLVVWGGGLERDKGVHHGLGGRGVDFGDDKLHCTRCVLPRRHFSLSFEAWCLCPGARPLPFGGGIVLEAHDGVGTVILIGMGTSIGRGLNGLEQCKVRVFGV